MATIFSRRLWRCLCSSALCQEWKCAVECVECVSWSVFYCLNVDVRPRPQSCVTPVLASVKETARRLCELELGWSWVTCTERVYLALCLQPLALGSSSLAQLTLCGTFHVFGRKARIDLKLVVGTLCWEWYGFVHLCPLWHHKELVCTNGRQSLHWHCAVAETSLDLQWQGTSTSVITAKRSYKNVKNSNIVSRQHSAGTRPVMMRNHRRW